MWNAILGHKKQIEQLEKAASSRQLPNAYLFSGLGGIGKKLVAEVFVHSLFCEKAPNVCGTCVPCTKIRNRSHPDVFFIEPGSENILIDQIRELQQSLQFHPLEGLQKITVIDNADQMTESAANSLLKILEEPPSNTHFILISAFSNRLLPTIRSRCRQIVFSPLKEDEVTTCLLNTGIDKENAARMAKISGGSVGSVAMLDGEFIEDVLGRFRIIASKANAADVIALAELWSKEDERAPLIFDLLANHYRDLIREKGSSRRLENDFFAIMNSRELLTNTTANKQLLFEHLLFTLVK